MKSYESLVRELAAGFELLDPSGELRPLGSIEIVDLIFALEREAKLTIPIRRVRAEDFASVAAIVKLLETIAAG